MVRCNRCGNYFSGHDCSKYVDRLKLDDGVLAYDLGIPHGATILTAIARRCDGSCVWPHPSLCSHHVECHCIDQHGNEFFKELTMLAAKKLMWRTNMRIYKGDVIGGEEREQKT